MVWTIIFPYLICYTELEELSSAFGRNQHHACDTGSGTTTTGVQEWTPVYFIFGGDYEQWGMMEGMMTGKLFFGKEPANLGI